MAIAKISGCRKTAKGTIEYLTDKEKMSEIQTLNLCGTTNQEILREFEAQTALSQKCENPYLHVSIAFDPEKEGLRIKNAEMFEYTQRYLEKMGLAEHQAVMVAHKDTAHPHVHVFVNRVQNDGLAWNNSYSKMRSVEAIKETSKEFEYEIVKQKHALTLDRTDIERLAQGETSWKAEIQIRVTDAIQHSNGKFEDFTRKLADNGIEIEFNSNKTGLGYRLDILNEQGDRIYMKASKVGKQYQLKAIKEKLNERLDYVLKRDQELKQAWKDVLTNDKSELASTIKTTVKEIYAEKYTGSTLRVDEREIRRSKSSYHLGTNSGADRPDSVSTSEQFTRLKQDIEHEIRRMDGHHQQDTERLTSTQRRDKDTLGESNRDRKKHALNYGERHTTRNEAPSLRETEKHTETDHSRLDDADSYFSRIRHLARETDLERTIYAVGRSEAKSVQSQRDVKKYGFKDYEALAQKAIMREVMKYAPKELKQAKLFTDALFKKDAKAFTETVFKHTLHEGLKHGLGSKGAFIMELAQSQTGKEIAQQVMNMALSTVPGGELLKEGLKLAKKLTQEHKMSHEYSR